MNDLIRLNIKDTNIPDCILISGKKRHGKDLFASQLRTQLTNLKYGKFEYSSGNVPQYYGVDHLKISRIAFADPIKQFAKLAFGLSEEQVNGRNIDKEAPIPFWGGLTPREIMQKIGTNLRDIDEDVFAKSLIARLENRKASAQLHPRYHTKRNISRHVFINSDCRYPNEINIIRQHLNSYFIRLIRQGVAPTPFDNHPSEVSLDNFNGWDRVVMNDGDIKDLREKAITIVAGWCKINVHNNTFTI